MGIFSSISLNKVADSDPSKKLKFPFSELLEKSDHPSATMINMQLCSKQRTKLTIQILVTTDQRNLVPLRPTLYPKWSVPFYSYSQLFFLNRTWCDMRWYKFRNAKQVKYYSIYLSNVGCNFALKIPRYKWKYCWTLFFTNLNTTDIILTGIIRWSFSPRPTPRQ